MSGRKFLSIFARLKRFREAFFTLMQHRRLSQLLYDPVIDLVYASLREAEEGFSST